MKLALYIFLFAFLGLISCINKPGPTLKVVTQSDAAEIAKAEFLRNGHKIEDYRMTLESDGTGKKWIVWFDMKSDVPVPGGKHSVTVEKETGKAIFMPGE